MLWDLAASPHSSAHTRLEANPMEFNGIYFQVNVPSDCPIQAGCAPSAPPALGCQVLQAKESDLG